MTARGRKEHVSDLLITGARPYGGDAVDLLVRDGVVTEMGRDLDAPGGVRSRAWQRA